MRVLGVETATWSASIGVVDRERVVAERRCRVTGSHATSLLPLVEATLRDGGMRLRELDLVAVSIGPGSFTGLRIGLSTAKGLALALGVDVVAVPTLAAFALTAAPRRGVICPILDARKREVYAAAFRSVDGGLATVVAPDVVSPETFARRVRNPCTLIGDGVDLYADRWRDWIGPKAELIPFAELAPSGGMVARLGARRFLALGAADRETLEPLYIRKSEAELNAPRVLAERGKIDSV